MTFSAKNVTQGGQVTAYNMRMYFQINNWIGFWSFVVFISITLLSLFVLTDIEIIKNGSWYWFADLNKGLFSSFGGNAQQTSYPIQYYYPPTNTTYTIKMTMLQMLADPYMKMKGQALLHSVYWCASVGGGISAILFMVATWYLGRIGQEQREDQYISGQKLSEDPAEVTKLMKSKNKASDLKIGKLTMVKNSEMQNFGMHGTVGTGKSTLMRELLDCIRKRGDRVIIWDSGCTFIETHYREGVDTILNPHDERCANWDLWGECLSMPDYDNMANALIPVEGDSADPFWVSSARTIFAAAAARMEKDSNRSIENLLRVLLSISIKNLRGFLQNTEAASLVEEKIEKTAISIRSVITNYVKSLRYLQGLDKKGRKKFTIREWMTDENNDSSWLFISANAQQKGSLRPLISMWLSLATIYLLSMKPDYNRRVWFFIDELPGLQKLPGLPDVMAEARKYGGCFVLGMQNMPQLMQIYGKNMGQSINDLLNTRFFYRSPSADVAQQVERELGRQRRKEGREQYSYGPDAIRDGVSIGKEAKHEVIVDYDQIMALEDLTCFVRFPGDFPVVKLKLERKEAKRRSEGFIPRDFNETLNPEIDSFVRRNEGVEFATSALFAEEKPEEKAEAPKDEQKKNAHINQTKEKQEKVEPTWILDEAPLDEANKTQAVDAPTINNENPNHTRALASEKLQIVEANLNDSQTSNDADFSLIKEEKDNSELQPNDQTLFNTPKEERTEEMKPAVPNYEHEEKKTEFKSPLLHVQAKRAVTKPLNKPQPSNHIPVNPALRLRDRWTNNANAGSATQDDSGSDKELTRKQESEDDQNHASAEKTLVGNLNIAGLQLTESEKQELNSKADYTVQAMLDEEKNILRHHRPGEDGYLEEMAMLGEEPEL